MPVPRRFDRRPPERDTTRINERIRVPQVRLIGADGEQLGIVDTPEALRRAQDADLDLVEVAPNSKPPVTRMLDYSKYKYEQEQKQKQARKHQQQVNIREIKLRPKIATHDYDTKKGHVERFLKHGDKVKITIMFRGREQAHPERGRALLQKLFEDLGGLAVIESAPLQEGRNMSMLLAPSKEARAAEEAAAVPAAAEADATTRGPRHGDDPPPTPRRRRPRPPRPSDAAGPRPTDAPVAADAPAADARLPRPTAPPPRASRPDWVGSTHLLLQALPIVPIAGQDRRCVRPTTRVLAPLILACALFLVPAHAGAAATQFGSSLAPGAGGRVRLQREAGRLRPLRQHRLRQQQRTGRLHLEPGRGLGVELGQRPAGPQRPRRRPDHRRRNPLRREPFADHDHDHAAAGASPGPATPVASGAATPGRSR